MVLRPLTGVVSVLFGLNAPHFTNALRVKLTPSNRKLQIVCSFKTDPSAQV
jgi:hypothetical protein